MFSLALVLNEAPQREWLVFAYAPLGDRRKVRVTIPDYRPVALDVPQAGAYYHVVERTGEVGPVLDEGE